MELEEFKVKVLPLNDKLRQTAKSMLYDADDADDAVQETFLRIWNVREQLSNHPNINGFTMQTLKNVCIDKIRKDKHTTSIQEAEAVASETETPYKYAELHNSMTIIEQIINSLPELQRTILQMRDVEGYELSEIAEITSTQISAVSMNLSRARKKVRDKFLEINRIRQ